MKHLTAPSAMTRRQLATLCLAACCLCLFQHVSAFSQKHNEGDEVVYLSLARNMGWDLSNYTTRNDPLVRRFPNSIYRAELFHHPPLYPFVLKLGGLFGASVAAGLLFAWLVISATFYASYRLLARLRAQHTTAIVVCTGLTFCPLLLFSTVRLHLDALFGLLLACAILAHIDALETGSRRRALLAACLWVATLNVRYAALAALPWIPLLHLFFLHRLRRRDGDPEAAELRRAAWMTTGIVAGLVLTLGLQHYYRVLWTYGTLLPGQFAVLDPDAAQFSPFLRSILERSRPRMLVYLLLLFPALGVFFLPRTYIRLRRAIGDARWEALFPLLFLYQLALVFVFTHQQLRYFAAATPALYLSLPFFLRERPHPALIGVGVVTLLSMVTTGFYSSVLMPPSKMMIVPALFLYLEPLYALYR